MKAKLIISTLSFSYFILILLETQDRVVWLIALQTGKGGKGRVEYLCL